jgi:hypothetical protein
MQVMTICVQYMRRLGHHWGQSSKRICLTNSLLNERKGSLLY